MPALARRIASATVLTASSCPITRLCSISSSDKSFSLSPSISLETGIPVQRQTILAMSSSVTLSCKSPFSPLPLSAAFSLSSSCFLSSGSLPYLSCAALLRSYSLSAVSASRFTRSISSRSFCTLFMLSFSFCKRAFMAEYFSLSSAISLRRLSSLASESLSVSFLSEVSSISRVVILRFTSSISLGIEFISVFMLAHASSTRSIALSGKNLSVIYLSDKVAAAISALS